MNINWIHRLCKWRTVFAGWQLGTRANGDPESDAVRDHRELSMALRADVNALTGLLIEKGVIGATEFTARLQDEAEDLCKQYERKFPGFVATDDGMKIDGRAAETTKGWRP